jgi:hypothetical protein
VSTKSTEYVTTLHSVVIVGVYEAISSSINIAPHSLRALVWWVKGQEINGKGW